MKRDREGDDDGQVPQKHHKIDDTDANEDVNALITDPSFREVGSYLVTVSDDIAYHICTTEDVITVHDAHGQLLKWMQR